MNLLQHGPLFFLLGGFLLFACGGLQLFVGAREKGRSPWARLATPAGFRILLFFAVGLMAILVGVGVIPLGGPRNPPQGH